MKPITQYRYHYDDELCPPWSKPKLILMIGSLVLSAILFLIVALTMSIGLALFGVLLPLAIVNGGMYIFLDPSNTRNIDFYPTFMTIGSQSIDFAQITEIDTSHFAEGSLTISYTVSDTPKRFLFERIRFPTNASQDWKIEKNTHEKLEKLLERILKQVQKTHDQYKAEGKNIANPIDSMQPIPPAPHFAPE